MTINDSESISRNQIARTVYFGHSLYINETISVAIRPCVRAKALPGEKVWNSSWKLRALRRAKGSSSRGVQKVHGVTEEDASRYRADCGPQFKSFLMPAAAEKPPGLRLIDLPLGGLQKPVGFVQCPLIATIRSLFPESTITRHVAKRNCQYRVPYYCLVHLGGSRGRT